MSTPIRRTTATLAVTGAMAVGSAGLLAGPAWAQYPPPDIEVIVTTPGATIEITGNEWGPGTTVTITPRNRSGASAEPVTATVAEDGTFTAPVEVPEDARGTEIQYVVSGVDEQGAERSETRALNVQLTSAEAPVASDAELASPVAPAEDDGGAGWLLAVGGAAALAGGAAVARRKVTSNG